MSYDVAYAAAEERNEFLPRVWAVRKVGTLLDDIRLHGEQPSCTTRSSRSRGTSGS